LRAIERELDGQPALARRVHKVAATLEGESGQWVDVETAQRLVGAATEATIHGWIELKLLQSRENIEGVQVNLDDVLRECRLRDALSGFGGEDDDPAVEHWGWQGRLPWRDAESAVAE
jgi:hypothetical protein